MHTNSTTALKDIRAVVGDGQHVVFVSGNFNIVHPGHLRLLKFAADCGDFLVVGVNAESTSTTLIPAEFRLEGVRAIGVVNYAFQLRDPPEDFIAVLKPAVVVKGKEHESEFNPEKSVVESYGGRLVFSSGEVIFSSLDLIRREFKEFNVSTIVKPLDFPARHHFQVSDLKSILKKFAGLRVLVIGDLIVDEYIACDALGMSQEDPTIVLTPVLRQKFVGGAGVVAGQAADLGTEVSLITVTGKDSVAVFAAETLKSHDVEVVFFGDESRPTTLKQRFRTGNKTLLRVSELKQHDIDIDLQTRMFDAVKGTIDKIDLVVFSDFNYGCLPPPLVAAIINLCTEKSIPMVADRHS